MDRWRTLRMSWELGFDTPGRGLRQSAPLVEG